MHRGASLVTFCTLLGCVLARPLQVPTKDTQEDIFSRILEANQETCNETGKDILTTIIEANKGVAGLHDSDIRPMIGRNAITCPYNTCYWPHSSDGRVRVPFFLSPIYSVFNRAMFTSATQEIATMTCVDFTNRTDEQDYLNIISGTGCWSYIGRKGGAQIVSLNIRSCMSSGVIVHELMHNLGFYHEHSRKDRNAYIDILWQFMNQSDQLNFAIEPRATTLDLPYDYSSVMHYPRNAYSNTSGQNTIQTKPDPTVPVGQRYGMSSLDLAKLNRLYNCILCRALLAAPSGSITVNSSTSLYPNNGNCIWLIRIPANKVLLRITNFNIQSSTACQSNYLKVYDGNSKTSPVLLNKTCGKGGGISVLASANNVLVELVYQSQNVLHNFNVVYNTG